jgi:arginine/ornithine N-succinyltransferase beta subunit
MTFAELKRLYQRANPNGHYFDKSSLRFFGDTPRNYGVRRAGVAGVPDEEGRVPCWELHRKKSVKCGLSDSCWFDASGRIVGRPAPVSPEGQR